MRLSFVTQFKIEFLPVVEKCLEKCLIAHNENNN